MDTAGVIGVVCLLLLTVPLSLGYSLFVAWRQPDKFNLGLPFYISAFAVMGYCIQPNYENDLIRYFKMLEECQTLPFERALDWADDGLIVKNLFFWIVAQAHDFHLLPFITVGTFYGVGAYIAYRELRNTKVLLPVLIFQTLASPIFLVTSNVRNIFAFSLIALGVYRDLCLRKRNLLTLFLYVAPCYIHMTGVVLVIIRCILPFIKRISNVAVFATIGVPSLTLYLYDRFRKVFETIPGAIGKILNRALRKAYGATMATSDYAVSMHESGYVTACRAVMVPLALILIYYAIRSRETDKTGFRSFSMLLFGITAVWGVLGVVKYWVFAAVSVQTGSVIFRAALDNDKNDQKESIGFAVLAILALLRFALEIYFIRTRIDVPEFFLGCMTTNVFTILFKLFRSIILLGY